MNAYILTIGTELVIGDILNTNASWMGRELTNFGFRCDKVTTINDDEAHIRKEIEEGLEHASITIVTGGLGPTKDDITKSVLYELFPSDPVTHQPTLDHVKSVLTRRNIPVTDSNIEQAKVPEAAEVLFNKKGTAPGMWFERNGHYLAVLPGVPSEMKHLMEAEVLPRLDRNFPEHPRYFSRYIKIAGIGESTLSDQLLPDIERFTNGTNLSVASLPGNGVITLRISTYAGSDHQAEEKLSTPLAYIRSQADGYIFAESSEDTIASAVGELLQHQNKMITVAESCTGGFLSNMITEVPGCSNWYHGGINCYSNAMKTDFLGVSTETLHNYGAVSKETALELAAGAAHKTGADVAVATTGIAGPSGGSNDKPVGTVWIGYYDENRHFAIKTVLYKDRSINKKQGAVIALDVVRRVLSGIDAMPYGLEPKTRQLR